MGNILENGLHTLRPVKIGPSFKEKGLSRVTGASLACGQGCEQINDYWYGVQL